MKNKFLKVSFVCLNLVLLLSHNKALSYDFTQKIYGKANLMFAYSIQPYSNSNPHTEDPLGHAFVLGGGYNVFYKINKTFAPFGGVELLFRIPLTGYKALNSYREFMMFHFKIGVKIRLNRDFSLLPYYIIGFNVAQVVDNAYNTPSVTEASLSTGLGVDLVIYDKYSVGFEWRHSRFGQTFAGVNYMSNVANNVSFKFGYHFL